LIMRHLHIPRIELDLAGVDPATVRAVADLLPGALTRALNGHADTTRAAPGSPQALAEGAAARVAAGVAAHLAKNDKEPTR